MLQIIRTFGFWPNLRCVYGQVTSPLPGYLVFTDAIPSQYISTELHLRLVHLGRKSLLQDTVSCGRFARILPRPCWKTSGRGPPAEGSPRSGCQVSFDQMVHTGVFQVGKETVGPSQDMMWMKNHGPDQMLILFSNQILCYEALLGGASHLKEWRRSHMCLVYTANVYNRFFSWDCIIGMATLTGS